MPLVIFKHLLPRRFAAESDYSQNAKPYNNSFARHNRVNSRARLCLLSCKFSLKAIKEINSERWLSSKNWIRNVPAT